MFPLNLTTPTRESYDPTSDVEKALKRVVLEPGQQVVMCNNCGCWWVADAHEYPKFDGHEYARIPICPHCELARAKARRGAQDGPGLRIRGSGTRDTRVPDAGS